MLPAVVCCAEQQAMDLAGSWRFAADPGKVGEAQKWFERRLEGRIQLPGSMTDNGLGDDISVDTPWTGDIIDRSWFTDARYAEYRGAGSVKVPFWLTPLKYYVGPAWYQRDIMIPDRWKDKRIVLSLERCHWETRLWVDGRYAGMRNSLATAHEYDLGSLEAGSHTLTLCVDNTVKIGVGINAHSVTDHTQTNWNGIVGAMRLTAGDRTYVDDVQVFPDVRAKRVQVVVTIRSEEGMDLTGKLRICARRKGAVSALEPREAPLPGGVKRLEVSLDYPMGEDVRLWDEFTPEVYELTVAIQGAGYEDMRVVSFGMRQIGTQGRQFTVNGRKTFLRGTLECCIFPLTGYPPTDEANWEKVLSAAKAHGLNHLRFHSWCPPKAAFDVADRMGFLFQIECSAWANQGSSIGDGKPVDAFIREEADRILRAYGNHPSFCMMAYGNEPAGGRQKEYLADLVESWKAKDRRRLYTSAAGWPIIEPSDFHSTPEPRIHAWGQGLDSRINARPPETRTDYRDIIRRYDKPVVSHEIGQWCVYPNLDETAKYTGVTRAYNFEIFRDSLKANGMLDQARDFLLASGKLQTLCYKEDIESSLRTPGMGGFQLLDLHDFPGQGTALVGVLDPFWESKGYVTAEEYHRFCCETVPLAAMSKRVWTNDQTFEADIEIAHFGPQPLKNAAVRWVMAGEQGRRMAAGRFPDRTIDLGNGTEIGRIVVPLNDVRKAQKLTLTVWVAGTEYANDWDIWVYPAALRTARPDDVIVRSRLDARALAVLEDGGKVLLMPEPGTIRGDEAGPVPPGFSSIFWNTAWTGRQPPHTLGILCDPKHPALGRFPTEYHSNWQWWDLVTKSQIMILNDMPAEVRPIVQVIDDWVTNRRLALVFEARVNGGRLLVCGIDLRSGLANRPVARQMRASLFDYMGSGAFNPKVEIAASAVQALFKEPSTMEVLGARVVGVDSAAAGYEGHKAIDGDPATIWHTAWEPQLVDYPHEITIAFNRSATITGFTYLPRQDMKNGWFSEYAFHVSDDGEQWGDPVVHGSFPVGKQLQKVAFAQPVKGQHVRLVAVKGVEGQRFAAIAELGIDIQE